MCGLIWVCTHVCEGEMVYVFMGSCGFVHMCVGSGTCMHELMWVCVCMCGGVVCGYVGSCGYVHMCVWIVYVCVGSCGCTHICISQRSSMSWLSTIVLWDRVSHWTQSIQILLVWLANKPWGILPSLPPQHWDYRHMPPHTCFYIDAGNSNIGLHGVSTLPDCTISSVSLVMSLLAIFWL